MYETKYHNARMAPGRSTEFFEFIHSIAKCTSQVEEEKLIMEDLRALKTAYKSGATLTEDQEKENVMRVMYAEMLGYPCSFAHIHCINLASRKHPYVKRTGYLATHNCISPDSELMYLIVANMQKDLRSSNFVDVGAALTAAARVLRPELIQVVLPQVEPLLGHEKFLIRRKAAETMHAFYIKTAGEAGDVNRLRNVLSDRDPSVMAAALNLLKDVAATEPGRHADLVDAVLTILKQIIEKRLPRAYDFHGVPAPWLQMRAVRLLQYLLAGSQSTALVRKCEPLITDVLLRAESSSCRIGLAIVAEVVRAIAAIPPHPALLELAGESVGKFIESSSCNMRFVGLDLLTHMVRVDPSCAARHQRQMMLCLDDADDSIRRKTISLLFAIANSDNVVTIAERLLVFADTATQNSSLRLFIIRGVCAIVEYYAVSATWFISFMNRTLLVAADAVPPRLVQRVLKLIADGRGRSEADDMALRARCVESYFNLTGQVAVARPLPETLLRVAVWVMGEYGFLTRRVSPVMLMDRLCDLFERTDDCETREWIVTAMLKLISQSGEPAPPNVVDLVAPFCDSRFVSLQQRCHEFVALCGDPRLLRAVLPLDGFCDDLAVDEKLSFLDGLVEASLQHGARPYQPQRASAVSAAAQARRGGGGGVGSGTGSASALRTAAYVPSSAKDYRFSEQQLEVNPSLHKLSGSGSTGGPFATAGGASLSGAGGAPALRTHVRRWGAENLRQQPDSAADEQRQMRELEEKVQLQGPRIPGSFGSGATSSNLIGGNGGRPTLFSSPAAGTATAVPQHETPDSAGAAAAAVAHSAVVDDGGADGVQPSKHSAALISDIFGGGGRKHKHKKAAAKRAAETQRIAEENRVATRGMTSSNTNAQISIDDILFGAAPTTQAAAASAALAPVAQPTAATTQKPKIVIESVTHSNPVETLFGGSASGAASALAPPATMTVTASRRVVSANEPPRYCFRVVGARGGRISVQPPPGMTLAFVSGVVATVGGAPSSSISAVIADSAVLPDGAAAVECAIVGIDCTRFLEPLLSARVTATVSPSSSSSSGTVSTSLPVELRDLLRAAPASFHTQQFGAMWSSGVCPKEASDRSVALRSVRTPTDFCNVASATAALTKVEVINQEVISAAEVRPLPRDSPPTASATMVLCHIMIQPNQTAILTVRSPSSALSHAVLESLRANV